MKLLVSVRDAVEAEIAVQCGVPIIDVKEPTLGSLGRPPDEVVREVIETVRGRCLVSVAMGEITPTNGPTPLPVDCHPDFAKVGSAGFRDRAGWCGGFHDWVRELPASAQPIAVVYADRAASDSGHLLEFARIAAAVSARGVLVDTQEKDGRSTFDYLSITELTNLRHAAHGLGIFFALAGSLSPNTLPHAALVRPDVIGIRGAACAVGRTSRIDAGRLRRFQSALSFHLRAASSSTLATPVKWSLLRRRPAWDSAGHTIPKNRPEMIDIAESQSDTLGNPGPFRSES